MLFRILSFNLILNEYISVIYNSIIMFRSISVNDLFPLPLFPFPFYYQFSMFFRFNSIIVNGFDLFQLTDISVSVNTGTASINEGSYNVLRMMLISSVVSWVRH